MVTPTRDACADAFAGDWRGTFGESDFQRQLLAALREGLDHPGTLGRGTLDLSAALLAVAETAYRWGWDAHAEHLRDAEG